MELDRRGKWKALAESPKPAISADTVPTSSQGTSVPEKESRPLSRDWFPSEVKDRYARALKAEQECIEEQTKLRAHVKPGQVQLEGLLKSSLSLMTECTDLFEATQYPSAGPDLNKLQLEKIRATTMWYHGIFTPLIRLLTQSSRSSWFRPIYLIVIGLIKGGDHRRDQSKVLS